jgi:L-alanine-DL-glutamate epimerase-like enolase superfamily enzyme
MDATGTLFRNAPATVDLQHMDVALSAPFRIAYETVTHAANILAVATDGEVTGYGEGAPVPAITGDDRDTGIAEARRWLDGHQAIPPDPRDHRTLTEIRSPAARAAIEGALLDVAAQRAGEPLVRFLRDRPVRPVATSITIPLVDDADVARLVSAYRRSGFSIFKVKAGLGVEADIERVRFVRDEAGPSAELRVDPNQAWTRQEARQALGDLRDLGVSFLEQPLSKDDLAGHAWLRRFDEVPIMLDESVFGPDDAVRAMRMEAADLINIKIQKSGGILAGLRIADLAQQQGVACMVGCMLETRLAITQAAHLALAHDNILYADLDGSTFLASDPVSGGARIVNGAVQVPFRAGLGIEAMRVQGTPRTRLQVAA